MELVEINPNSSSSREPPCAFVRLAPVGRSSDFHCISKPLAANSPQPVCAISAAIGQFSSHPTPPPVAAVSNTSSVRPYGDRTVDLCPKIRTPQPDFRLRRLKCWLAAPKD